MIEVFNLVAYWIGAVQLGLFLAAIGVASFLIALSFFFKLVGLVYDVLREWFSQWRS